MSGIWQSYANDNNPVPQAPNSATNDIGDLSKWNYTINLQAIDPIQHGVKSSTIGNGSRETGWKWLFKTILGRITNFMLVLIPLIAAVSLIIAGYFYIFSFADGDFPNKAKIIIKYNLLAMTVAFLSWVIISVIANFFD